MYMALTIRSFQF